MTLDQAHRVIAYSDLGETNPVTIEARRVVLDYETKIEQRIERWMGLDD